jgi:thiamine-monophosphate kinase
MSRDETALGSGGESDAIREILARLGETASDIGDDASILDVPRGEKLVVSTDAAVENRHFRSDWLTPEEIAYRAVTAALSDLAAMAAQPIGILWALNLPESWRSKLPALTDGAREAARAVNAKIVGGNLTAAGELSITTTVIGSAFRPLRRSGARPGDHLYVTGSLGGPALALDALMAGRTPGDAHRARFAKPVARFREARRLADRGATAAIDLSDGLAGDALHLAAASGVGLQIQLDNIPCFEGADALTAARSGEEYELLVAGPEIDGFVLWDLGNALHYVGMVTDSARVEFLKHGRPVDVGTGHDHFNK